MLLFFSAYMVSTNLALSVLLVEVICVLKEDEGGNILLSGIHKLLKIIVI
jgi:hypothetical protein